MNIEGVLDLLVLAKNDLSHADYVNIWGKVLGNHIWRQEGSDLLKIWDSGLSKEQKKAFVDYLIYGTTELGMKKIEKTIIPREKMLKVANSMIKNGGSFVESLGQALLQADEINQQKIKKAFPEYWEKYKRW